MSYDKAPKHAKTMGPAGGRTINKNKFRIAGHLRTPRRGVKAAAMLAFYCLLSLS